jgi:hypothetical protein
MVNKILCKRKYDRTRDETRHNEQAKECYWRKKRERENIEGRNNDDVNRDLHPDSQQEEVQPGMHTYCLD